MHVGRRRPARRAALLGLAGVWVLVLAAGASAAAGRPDIRQAPERLAAVDSLIAAGQAAQALAEVGRLAVHWRDDPLFGWQLADRRGLALLALGRFAEALPLLEETVGRRPFAAGPHRNLGLALAALGRRGRALAEYAQAVELDPGNPVHRLEHAQYLAEFGQLEAAAAAFAAAARLCGGCPEAERGLGAALLGSGRPGEAVAPLQRAQAAAPDTSGRRLLVAALHGARRDSALLALLDGEDRSRWDRRDHLALVEAEGWTGGPAVRSQAYARALQQGAAPPPIAADALFWARVALNLLQSGAWQDGLAAADRAVALEPANAVYRNNRVVLLLKLGRTAEAQQEWEHALRLDPGLARKEHP
ncbi:MAG: tetratricopeptide repeat protein [Candidatus Krumholzibacteriia bacterium]